VPLYEILLNGPSPDQLREPATAQALMTIFVFVLTSENSGEVTLHSADPLVAPRCDPRFFSHSFGRGIAIEATPDVLRVVNGEAFREDTTGMLHGPKSKMDSTDAHFEAMLESTLADASDSEFSDEDILKYWRTTMVSTWHMTGNVMVGKAGDKGACADREFRVVETK